MEKTNLPEKITYKNKAILTSKQLAEFYECNSDKIRYNFNYNKDRYEEGKHYFALKGQAKQDFIKSCEFHTTYLKVPTLYLWTEKGAFLHAKSLSTDKALETYDFLIDFYFRKQEKPKSGLDALQALIDELRKQDAKIVTIGKQVTDNAEVIKEVKAKITTRDENYYTVAGYAGLIDKSCNLKLAQKIGRAAKKLSLEQNYKVGSTRDARYTSVGTYHLDILKQLDHLY